MNNHKNYTELFAEVPQNVYLKNSSLLDNIVLESGEVNYDLLSEAIEKSELESFVKSLPNGVNTIIGENGKLLSGGQKQRIGIARAIYKSKPIIIFDEATSALDTKTEEQLIHTIEKIRKAGTTILLITHNYRNLVNCDQIYHLKNKRLSSLKSGLNEF